VVSDEAWLPSKGQEAHLSAFLVVVCNGSLRALKNIRLWDGAKRYIAVPYLTCWECQLGLFG
jgi:hypothetical protein